MVVHYVVFSYFPFYNVCTGVAAPSTYERGIIMELSKDADKLICLLYKHYLEQRKLNVPKSTASSFGSSHNIHEQLCPDWLFEDVDDTCRELSRAKMLNCIWADNIAYHVAFTDQAIVYMEKRFENNVGKLIDFISKFF